MRHFGYAIGFAVLLAAIYVGMYSAMVERVVNQPLQGFDRDPREMIPYYHCGQQFAAFFDPVHVVDRRIRPSYWGK